MRLEGNRFSYPDGGTDGTNARDRFASLVDGCLGLGSSSRCDGLPPVSCAAFGPDFRILASDPRQCIRCDPDALPVAIAGVVLLSVGLLAALSAYVFCVRRHGQSLRKGISSLTIVVTHVQTLSIVGYLSLAWPPSVHAVTGTLSLSFVDMEFVRPECLSEVRSAAPSRATGPASRDPTSPDLPLTSPRPPPRPPPPRCAAAGCAVSLADASPPVTPPLVPCSWLSSGQCPSRHAAPCALFLALLRPMSTPSSYSASYSSA